MLPPYDTDDLLRRGASAITIPDTHDENSSTPGIVIHRADGSKFGAARYADMASAKQAAALYNDYNVIMSAGRQASRDQRRKIEAATAKAQEKVQKKPFRPNAQQRRLIQQTLMSIDPERAAMYVECLRTLNVLGKCVAYLNDKIDGLFDECFEKGLLAKVAKGVEAADNILNALILTQPKGLDDNNEAYNDSCVDAQRIFDIVNMLATYGHLGDADNRPGDLMLSAVERAIDRVMPEPAVQSYRLYMGRDCQRFWDKVVQNAFKEAGR